MHPTSIEGKRFPPELIEPDLPKARVDFFQTVNPFVQLLITIGNTVFFSACFVYEVVVQKLLTIQTLFTQTTANSNGSPVASTSPL
jgi:hypothetical protein